MPMMQDDDARGIIVLGSLIDKPKEPKTDHITRKAGFVVKFFQFYEIL